MLSWSQKFLQVLSQNKLYFYHFLWPTMYIYAFLKNLDIEKRANKIIEFRLDLKQPLHFYSYGPCLSEHMNWAQQEILAG